MFARRARADLASPLKTRDIVIVLNKGEKMAEVTRTLYPKRMRNREIEESIRLAMAQFQVEKAAIMAARGKTPRIEFPSAIRLDQRTAAAN